VIAGSARGRTLTAPRGLAIRPTTDKVKGAMFSMLDAEAFRRAEEDGDSEGEEVQFPFRRVLDLFAGTGALGIEALSRGSEHCDFVESNPRARAAIEENLRRTRLTQQASIYALRAENSVSTFRAPYDLILADPPYADPTLPELLATIGASGIIHVQTLVMIEHARSVELPTAPGRLRLSRSRYHGTTAITLYTSGASDVGKPPSLQ
jgi:16S rRNA (guanine966-N2)-methyltransferase